MDMIGNVEEAVRELKRGKPILIHDWQDRENEVDMVYYAGQVDQENIYNLRVRAGGLICYGTSSDIISALRLTSMEDLLSKGGYEQLTRKRPSYGDKSPFIVWVNSVKVKTGISDSDRALTISQLHEVVSLANSDRIEEARNLFFNNFYAPGHVPVLSARNLNMRRGHTELSIALTKMAGLEPSVVYAEMLDKGRSLSLEKAIELAKRDGLVLITGEEILSAWE